MDAIAAFVVLPGSTRPALRAVPPLLRPSPPQLARQDGYPGVTVNDFRLTVGGRAPIGLRAPRATALRRSTNRIASLAT